MNWHSLKCWKLPAAINNSGRWSLWHATLQPPSSSLLPVPSPVWKDPSLGKVWCAMAAPLHLVLGGSGAVGKDFLYAEEPLFLPSRLWEGRTQQGNAPCLFFPRLGTPGHGKVQEGRGRGGSSLTPQWSGEVRPPRNVPIPFLDQNPLIRGMHRKLLLNSCQSQKSSMWVFIPAKPLPLIPGRSPSRMGHISSGKNWMNRCTLAISTWRVTILPVET